MGEYVNIAGVALQRPTSSDGQVTKYYPLLMSWFQISFMGTVYRLKRFLLHSILPLHRQYVFSSQPMIKHHIFNQMCLEVKVYRAIIFQSSCDQHIGNTYNSMADNHEWPNTSCLVPHGLKGETAKISWKIKVIKSSFKLCHPC